MKNWYTEVKTEKQKLDKNFKKHHILPRSMIMCIGGTGTGKTNALMDLLDKKNDVWHKIIIFNPNNTDEPLYNHLSKNIDLDMINDIKELPDLNQWDEKDNGKEKLIVFDDFINVDNKGKKKIQDYLISGRKKGFTCYLMSQSYKDVPKMITRNIHYFIIFKLNDNISIDNIIRNHNVDNLDKADIKNFYHECVSEPMNFMMIDLKGDGVKRFRKNWLGFKGGKAKSGNYGFVKKLMYTPEFDIGKVKTPSKDLLLFKSK
jgi:hypothetical protein